MPLLLVQTIIGSWDKASGVGKNGTSALSRNVAENELATSYTAFNLAYKVGVGERRHGRDWKGGTLGCSDETRVHTKWYFIVPIGAWLCLDPVEETHTPLAEHLDTR